MRINWKKALPAAVLLLALLLLIVGDPVVLWHNRQLKRALTSLRAGQVTLNEVVPFQWDIVYTFDPYATKEEMERQIGFSSSSLRESISEDMVQLVFVQGKRVTASVCSSISGLGYEVLFYGRISADEHAVFTVRRESGIVVLTRAEE